MRVKFDILELKELWGEIRRVDIIFRLLPVMENIDKLRYAVFRKVRIEKKELHDLKYWKHETELLEMDLRVNELLTLKNKNDGNSKFRNSMQL